MNFQTGFQAVLVALLLAGAQAQQAPKPIDKLFVVEHAAMFAATAADCHYTNRNLAAPGYRELNPILGAHPSPAKVWAFGMGTSAGFTALDVYLARRYRAEPAAGKFMPIVVTLVHSMAAAHNASIAPRGNGR